MKFILILLFFLAVLTSNAQSPGHFYFNWDSHAMNENPLTDDMKGKVAEVRIKKTFRKAKKNKSVQKHYDEKGFVTLYEVNGMNGELKWKSEAVYNTNGKMTAYKNYTTKGLQKERINSYDDQMRITETVSKNGKGKITQRSTWTYGSGKCATSSASFTKNGQVLSRMYTYSFYKDCDPSKTVLTNSKGKVLKTWTYDCKKEGEQLVKKKDETQVCKYEETDGKYLTRVFQNFDEKGRIQKSVQKFTLEDTLLVEVISYDDEDKIRYRITYDKSFDRQTSYVSYNKKGKEVHRRESLYIDKKIQSTAVVHKGKKSSETFYTYNEKGWLSKIESFGKDDQKISTQEFEYILL